jgi:hypothetical protein
MNGDKRDPGVSTQMSDSGKRGGKGKGGGKGSKRELYTILWLQC